MPEYRVKWEMDVEADTPQDAARVARDYQLDPDAIVGVFDVREWKTAKRGGVPAGDPVRVDLDALEGRYATDDVADCSCGPDSEDVRCPAHGERREEGDD